MVVARFFPLLCYYVDKLFFNIFLMSTYLKVRAENLKKEKEMLKLSEVRLSQQRESLLAEQRGQNLLLTNLQTIQVTKKHM